MAITDIEIVELIAQEERARRELEARTNEDWITVRDVAEHFGVQLSTVYGWISQEWLQTHTHRKHERYQILASSVNELTAREYELLPQLRRYLPRVVYGNRNGKGR